MLLVLLVTGVTNGTVWADTIKTTVTTTTTTTCAAAERWDKDLNQCVLNSDSAADADYKGVYTVQQANARYDLINHVSSK